MATAVVGFVVGTASLTSLGLSFGNAILDIAGNNVLLALFLTMITSIIVGTGVPTTSVGSATEINTKEMLSLYGLDYTDKKNVKADFVGYNEAAELMKNRQADMAMIAGGLPTSSILDMATSFDIKLLDIEPEMIKKITEKYPWYFEYVIPKGTYKGQDQDVRTLAVANILLVRKDLSDELVYQLTKTLYEGRDQLIAAHDTAKYMTLESALNGYTAPIHPGAAKYYKEKGLDVSKVMQP